MLQTFLPALIYDSRIPSSRIPSSRSDDSETNSNRVDPCIHQFCDWACFCLTISGQQNRSWTNFLKFCTEIFKNLKSPLEHVTLGGNTHAQKEKKMQHWRGMEMGLYTCITDFFCSPLKDKNYLY